MGHIYSTFSCIQCPEANNVWKAMVSRNLVGLLDIRSWFSEGDSRQFSWFKKFLNPQKEFPGSISKCPQLFIDGHLHIQQGFLTLRSWPKLLPSGHCRIDTLNNAWTPVSRNPSECKSFPGTTNFWMQGKVKSAI